MSTTLSDFKFIYMFGGKKQSTKTRLGVWKERIFVVMQYSGLSSTNVVINTVTVTLKPKDICLIYFQRGPRGQDDRTDLLSSLNILMSGDGTVNDLIATKKILNLINLSFKGCEIKKIYYDTDHPGLLSISFQDGLPLNILPTPWERFNVVKLVMEPQLEKPIFTRLSKAELMTRGGLVGILNEIINKGSKEEKRAQAQNGGKRKSRKTHKRRKSKKKSRRNRRSRKSSRRFQRGGKVVNSFNFTKKKKLHI